MSEEEEGQEKALRRRKWIVVAGTLFILAAVGAVAGLRSFSDPTAADFVPVADVSSERLLALGSVVGFAAQHDTHAFLGIPFASPPVGPLRWRAPQGPEAWADTFDALSFGPPCPQLTSPLGGVPPEQEDGYAGSEDCLYLNVWVPSVEAEDLPSRNERLPVMVWIHGGGNVRGHAGAAMYDGAQLAGSQRIVLVSFNYRLGPLGWFAHPSIRDSASNALEASGNFGTLDQIRALEWVRDNIAEFGGDPENVTIFGQSAGGTNVFALMLADSARGLFHRAIVQSGSTDSVSESDAESSHSADSPGRRHGSAATVVSILVEAGLVPDREAARGYASELPHADLAELLRSRSAREILNAYRNPDRPDVLEVPTLIRDGVLLPEENWLDALRSGSFSHVPLVLGSTRDEEKLYLSQDVRHTRKYFGVLYRIRNRADYARRARYHSDVWAVRGVTRPAEAIQESGWPELYAYRFDWDALPQMLGQDLSELLGAAHGLELPLLFGTFDVGDSLLSRLIYPAEARAVPAQLSEQMMSYWAEFARTGRPSRGGRSDLPDWPRWSLGEGDQGNLLVLDDPSSGGIRVLRTTLSRDEVLAGLEGEPELGPAEKCELFLDLFSDRPDWNIEEFAETWAHRCFDSESEAAARKR